MKVFVDSSTNNPRQFAVDFDPSDSVQRLKSRIFEKGQIDPSDQTLSYEAKPLKDAQTLQSYGIKPDARIQLSVKLRGGSESKESKPLLKNESSSIEQKKNKKNKKTYSGVSLQKAINQALDDSNLLPPDFKNIEDLKSTFSEKVEEKEKQVTRDGCWELGRHQDNAMSVSISGDGRYVVTGGNDMAMKIFNFEMKTEVFCLENAHEDTLRKVVFTSDSKYIVSCSDDLAVKIFKFENEQAKEIFCLANLHKERITALAVSHDCTYVLSGSKDRSINVLDFVRKESGQVELRLKHTFAQAHEGELKAVAISRDNKFFASASYDGTIKMFSIEEKAEVHAWTHLHSFGASCVTVSSDNKYILSGGGDGHVRVLDVETKQLVNSFIYEKRYLARNEISSVVLSNNNKYLIAADGDKSILVYDFQMNHLIHHIHQAHSGKIEQLAVCADNHYIASCSTDFSVKAFELEVKNEVHYFQKAHSAPILDTIISNDNKYIISCSGDGSIKVFDRLKKQEIFAFERAHSNSIQTIAISHDDRYIVSGSSDQTIKIFELESREEVGQIQGQHKSTIGNILISSDDKYLISSDWKGIVNVFDFKTRKLIHSFGDPQKERAIFALAISNNNRYVAAAAMKNIKLFDLVTLQSTYEFMAAHNKQIHSLRITHDGRYLISGSEDNSIKVFDIETKALVHHIENVHEEKLLTLDVSKDGKYIITGSKERSVKIFNAENKLMLCEINNVHEVALSKVVISNDKKFFVTASYQGDMKIHNFPFSDESWVFRRSSVIPPYLAIGSYHNLLLKISNDTVRTQNMLIYKDLLFLPYNWNILHLMAIFEPMNIPIIPSYSVLKMSTLVDTYKKTPLHYLLAQGNIDNTAANILFKYILDYVEDKKDNLQEYNEIFSSLTNLFPFIMSKINPSLRERFLNMSIHDITYPYNEKPIRFGKEESKSCFSKTSTLTPDVEQKIYQNGESQVSFSALKLNFDYHPLSDDMLNATIALSANSNENIFQSKAVSHLIDHLWNTSWTFHCVVGILFSALMILMSVYIGLGDRSLGLEITMLVLCIFFLASEYFQVYNQRLNYLAHIWNWADLSYFKIFIATIIVRFCDVDDDLTRGWLYSVLIIIGYVRWMSYFQLFGTTRKLIQFIRAVIWDMWGYIAILGFIIVGFALIFLEYDREQDYLTHLYATYNLLFGNSDDEGYDASQKIMLAIVLFFLCVVLLNLLISIMGASHGKVQDEEVVTEAHTKLDMILESTLLMRLVSISREEKRGYLMFCEPDYAEENDTEEAELEGKIKVFRNMIKQNDQKINQMQESMKVLEKKVSQNYRDILKAIAENKKRK